MAGITRSQQSFYSIRGILRFRFFGCRLSYRKWNSSQSHRSPNFHCELLLSKHNSYPSMRPKQDRLISIFLREMSAVNSASDCYPSPNDNSEAKCCHESIGITARQCGHESIGISRSESPTFRLLSGSRSCSLSRRRRTKKSYIIVIHYQPDDSAGASLSVDTGMDNIVTKRPSPIEVLSSRPRGSRGMYCYSYLY